LTLLVEQLEGYPVIQYVDSNLSQNFSIGGCSQTWVILQKKVV